VVKTPIAPQLSIAANVSLTLSVYLTVLSPSRNNLAALTFPVQVAHALFLRYRDYPDSSNWVLATGRTVSDFVMQADCAGPSECSAHTRGTQLGAQMGDIDLLARAPSSHLGYQFAQSDATINS
jgi:hypothetical protein